MILRSCRSHVFAGLLCSALVAQGVRTDVRLQLGGPEGSRPFSTEALAPRSSVTPHSMSASSTAPVYARVGDYRFDEPLPSDEELLSILNDADQVELDHLQVKPWSQRVIVQARKQGRMGSLLDAQINLSAAARQLGYGPNPGAAAGQIVRWLRDHMVRLKVGPAFMDVHQEIPSVALPGLPIAEDPFLGRLYAIGEVGEEGLNSLRPAIIAGMVHVLAKGFGWSILEERIMRDSLLRQWRGAAGTYLLLNALGQAVGVAETERLPAGIVQVDRLATTPSSPPGSGAYLFSSLMARWKAQGMASVRWVATHASVGFYHRFLRQRMDYVFEEMHFDAYPSTYLTLTDEELRLQREMLYAYESRSAGIASVLFNLLPGRYRVYYSKSRTVEYELDKFRQWRFTDPRTALSVGRLSAMENLLNALVYLPNASLVRVENQQVIVEPNPIPAKPRVRIPSVQTPQTRPQSSRVSLKTAA